MINTSLSPNTQYDDFRNALSVLINPVRYCSGVYPKRVKDWFKQYFNVPYVSSFDSARTAIYFALKESGIGEGDEVIVQSFTCVAAVNPIKWTGAKPVYVDIDPENYNADLDDVENKITEKTKGILVQHTFGYPADMKRLKQMVAGRKILLIEDCTHTIGTEYDGENLGTIGDIGVFSLGRDKAVSASFGGVAITKKKKLGTKMSGVEEFLNYPQKRWIWKQLLFTVTTYLTVRLYETFSIGKLIHFISKRFTVRESTTIEEKECGDMPLHAKSKLPNAFAQVAYKQLQKIDTINARRHELSTVYRKHLEKMNIGAITLPGWKGRKALYPIRYPLQVQKRDELIRYMQRRNVFLGDWYDVPVAPRGVDLKAAGYKSGSCPNAEMIAKKVINLPLHINLTEEDAIRVVHMIKDFYS